MTPLLLEHPEVIDAFARSSLLVAFDYDGTLAPISGVPKAARMREGTRRLLTRVAQLYPCVVISGRALGDLTRRLEGLGVRHVFGNLGLESVTRDHEPLANRWLRTLHERLPQAHGMVIEDKGYTLTIHYRDVEDKPAIVAAIHEVTGTMPGVRAIAGIEAVSLMPDDGRHKGLALQEARRQFGCDTALFVGDDDTDEDAFASAEPHELLGVRVGPPLTTRASFRLDSQLDIDRLLRALILARDQRQPEGSVSA